MLWFRNHVSMVSPIYQQIEEALDMQSAGQRAVREGIDCLRCLE